MPFLFNGLPPPRRLTLLRMKDSLSPYTGEIKRDFVYEALSFLRFAGRHFLTGARAPAGTVRVRRASLAVGSAVEMHFGIAPFREGGAAAPAVVSKQSWWAVRGHGKGGRMLFAPTVVQG